jgi:endonuclease/exonuclease/phosphatase family metal-dependent hydrolase
MWNSRIGHCAATAVACLALSTVVDPAVLRSQVPNVRIAAWNVASGRSATGATPIPADRLTRVSNVIRSIAPDLIVLSEVNPNNAAQNIATQLGADFAVPIILQQGAGVVQNLAILHKTSVTVSAPVLIDGTDLNEDAFSRKALAADVKVGQFDFLLIGVHLKSGRTAPERAQRERQTRAIADFIATRVKGAEKDVLVVGDYNMIPAQDGENFQTLSGGKFLRFVSSETLSSRASHISKCAPFRGNLLDGFAISQAHTQEYVSGSLRLLRFSDFKSTCSKFARPSSPTYVSDHLPLVATFSVAKDDD